MTVLLHGFWGEPRDWSDVIARLPLGEEVWAPDLFEDGPLSPEHKLDEWVDSFLQQLRARTDRPVRLVGYSMGGRLGLNALARRPEAFERALVLSAAPTMDEQTPDDRAVWEREWANRFLVEEWGTLEREWQDQPVLRASAPQARRRSEALRARLSAALANWSPRHHRAMDARELPATVTWAFGASDQKYARVAKSLQALPVKGQVFVIPDAGHRLVNDAVAFVADWIERG